MEEMAMNRKWSVWFGRRLAIGLGAAALAAGLLPTAALAQDYPTRPVTFVVGFGVGGSADRTARAIAQFLPQAIGQPVPVRNRSGAGGQLAATYVLQQPAEDRKSAVKGTSVSGRVDRRSRRTPTKNN